MFKGEYQGGPFVDVFSAQGREPLSKKCKVTGSSTNIHKEYDKDVKSYVYVLEGEPTTTKIQFPKEDKHGLFLTQKFLVFQLFLPTGRPFSFEIAVTDHGQNKRRIFFSSNLKDISVTPLHAKFPLTILNLGSWLNMCLDLESLVSDTFNGPKFRAVESFTVTANCRLKKVFTLRAPPIDTSQDQNLVVLYTNAEPLPRNLQLITTSDVSTITQILSYTKLYGKPDEKPSTPLSTPSGHDGTTPRQDQETHIAFGTKVVIPPHLRRNSLKENRESSKIPHNSRLSSSKTKHGQSAPDVRHTNDDLVKSPLSPKGNQDGGSSDSTGIDANQATIQPRPPRTSSAGKIRRPIRLKSSSAGKTRTSGKIANANERQPDSLERNSLLTEQKCLEEISVGLSEVSDPAKAKAVKTKSVRIVSNEADERLKTVDMVRSSISDAEKLTVKRSLHNGIENDPISFNGTNTDAQELSIMKLHNGHVRLSFEGRLTNEQNDCSEIQVENSAEIADQMSKDNLANTGNATRLSNGNMNFTNANALVNKSTNKQSLDNVTSEEEDTKNIDMNNNDALADKDSDQPRIRPRKLPLASNNPVFTFASMPRSPRSGKRKLLDSPMVDDVITPGVEAPPEVVVSLTEDAILENPTVRNAGQSERNRGACLEDDFCKLSDDDTHDEDADGIQKLLQSSLSPRHSPMPFHHQLRQSIRSSMLKEIPSPVKENGYDAQNYQSDNHLDTLNQSTASSWRFDTSDSSSSFNQTQQDLEDSLNNTSFPKAVRHIAAIADIPVVDDNDEDCHSDCSDDTTCSAWRTPPQDMRGNKYQNEMKPLGQEPDLTATICMDPRDYCDVFSPPIILGTPNKENNSAISNLSPLKSPYKFPANHQEEEELDLLYDPCLNCYFDPTTHKYYELA